jgi:hypothetical protein
MVSESALRGYVLEEVLARLLSRSGYRLLVEAGQDPDALRDGRHGLLVRGRGSDHQADALGELLIPTPFSLPLRLFLEAKFREDRAGLADVRNALGVVNDVNEQYASGVPRDLPLRRHHYRYVLVSVSGFTEEAQKYALAHQISLIELEGSAFADLRAITEKTAKDLLELAAKADLVQFPLTQMRQVMRNALGTWNSDGDFPDTTYEGAYARSVRASPSAAGEVGFALPAEELATIAAKLSEELDDVLILGFPQGPFILVLQADDPAAFARFLRDWPSSELNVDIRYGSATPDGPGEWAIALIPGRDDLVVRFGVPPLMESWLLAEDAAELERAAQAQRVLFSTIIVFRADGRTLQLRYRKVARHESSADEVLSDPIPVLRRQLASPSLSFRGRQERGSSELVSEISEWPAGFGALVDEEVAIDDLDAVADPPELDVAHWTLIGLGELLDRLDDEHLVQAKVIRAAAQEPNGQLPREFVFDLGEYEAGRTLRGFTRPVNRITRQLQREGLVGRDVAPALDPVYERGAQATYFAVPPDVRDLLTASKTTAHSVSVKKIKNGIDGPDDFLSRIPDQKYRDALGHIFNVADSLYGLEVFWGTTGCSLRVVAPGRGLLSIGWIFPPGISSWMGLSDLTLGWDQKAQGITLSEHDLAVLKKYFEALSSFGGDARPSSGVIRGWTFQPQATMAHAPGLAEVIRTAVIELHQT